MKIYILDNGCYAQELFEQLILTNKKYIFGGFVVLDLDKAIVISDSGVDKYVPNLSDIFILGSLNKDSRDAYLEYIGRTVPISKSNFPNFFGNHSYISKQASLGFGNICLNFSSLKGLASIGNFNILHDYVSIANNTTVGSYNTFQPYSNVMPNCLIGDNNNVATKATITDKIIIGNDNIVSAGECVFDNLKNQEMFQSGIITKIKDRI